MDILSFRILNAIRQIQGVGIKRYIGYSQVLKQH